MSFWKKMTARAGEGEAADEPPNLPARGKSSRTDDAGALAPLGANASAVAAAAAPIPFLDLGLDEPPSAVAYDPAQATLAVATPAGRVHVFGRPGLAVAIPPVAQMSSALAAWISHLAFAVGTPFLVAATRSGLLVSYNMTMGGISESAASGSATDYPVAVQDILARASRRVTSLAAGAFSGFVYAGCHDGGVAVIDVRTAALAVVNLAPPAGAAGTVAAVAACPSDPNLVAVAYENCAVVLFDAARQQAAAKFLPALLQTAFDPAAVSRVSLAWRITGSHLAVSYDHRICIWAVRNQRTFQICRTLQSIIQEPSYAAQTLGAGLSLLGLAASSVPPQTSPPQQTSQPKQTEQPGRAYTPITFLAWVAQGPGASSLVAVGGRAVGDLQGATVLEFDGERFNALDRTRLIAVAEPVGNATVLPSLAAAFPIAGAAPPRLANTPPALLRSFTMSEARLLVQVAPESGKPSGSLLLLPLAPPGPGGAGSAPQPLPSGLQLLATTASSKLIVARTLSQPPLAPALTASAVVPSFAGGASVESVAGSGVWAGSGLVTLDAAGLAQLWASGARTPNPFVSSLGAAVAEGWVCTGQQSLALAAAGVPKDVLVAQAPDMQFLVARYADSVAVLGQPCDEPWIDPQSLSARDPLWKNARPPTPTLDDVDALLADVGAIARGDGAPGDSSEEEKVESPDSGADEAPPLPQSGWVSVVTGDEHSFAQAPSPQTLGRRSSSYYLPPNVTCPAAHKLWCTVESAAGAPIDMAVTLLGASPKSRATLLWLALPGARLVAVHVEARREVWHGVVDSFDEAAPAEIVRLASAGDALPPPASSWGVAAAAPIAAPHTSVSWVVAATATGAATIVEASLDICSNAVRVIDRARIPPARRFPLQLALVAVAGDAADSGQKWAHFRLVCTVFSQTGVAVYAAHSTHAASPVVTAQLVAETDADPASPIASGALVAVRDPDDMRDALAIAAVHAGSRPAATLYSFPSLAVLRTIPLPDTGAAASSWQAAYDGHLFNVAMGDDGAPARIRAYHVLRRPPAIDQMPFERVRDIEARGLWERCTSNTIPVPPDQSAGLLGKARVALAAALQQPNEAPPPPPPHDGPSDAAKEYLRTLNSRADAAESANIAHEAKEKLELRGQKLDLLNEKMSDLEAGSKSFLDNVKELNRRQESRKWWQF